MKHSLVVVRHSFIHSMCMISITSIILSIFSLYWKVTECYQFGGFTYYTMIVIFWLSIILCDSEQGIMRRMHQSLNFLVGAHAQLMHLSLLLVDYSLYLNIWNVLLFVCCRVKCNNFDRIVFMRIQLTSEFWNKECKHSLVIESCAFWRSRFQSTFDTIAPVVARAFYHKAIFFSSNYKRSGIIWLFAVNYSLGFFIKWLILQVMNIRSL